MAKKAKTDLYQEITDQIIAELEQGTARWVKPWDQASAPWALPNSGVTGKTYRGVNILNLMGVSEFYNSPAWITYKQAQAMGGNVIKGQRGSKLVFFKELTIEDKETEEEKKIPMIKDYAVFNAEQVEGIDLDMLKGANTERPADPESVAMDLANTVGAKVHQGGLMAANADFLDAITMPAFDTFKNADHYAATLFHELTHWTGSKLRLDREKGRADGLTSKERDAYAFEELVAELGAAFLCAHFGIANEQLQHAEYIDSWLSVLKGDKKAIHRAASQAQKAVDYLLERSQIEAQAA